MSSFYMNILIIGDSGAGKTTFVNKHKNGEFTKDHIPTKRMESSLFWHTNYGLVQLNIFEGTKINHHIDAVIIMFDLLKTNLVAIKEHLQWARLKFFNAPIVLCGSNFDQLVEKTKTKYGCVKALNREIAIFIKQNHITYYPVSSRTNYNYEKPFLYLMKEFFKSDIKLVEHPSLLPPEIHDSSLEFRKS